MKRCVECGACFEAKDWQCPGCGHAPERGEGFPVFAPRLMHSSPSYDGSRHEMLRHVEENHFWFETRAQLIRYVFLRFSPRARSYLEVGCGTGFVMRRLEQTVPDLRIVGTDLLLSGLHVAATRLPGAELIQADVSAIPYQDEFCVVGAFDVIEHIQDDVGALAELFQVVKPGGALVVTVPQYPSLWSFHDEQAGHVRRYRADELRAKATEAGFRVTYLTSAFATTLPLVWLSRRRRQSESGGMDEYRPPRLLNAVLRALLRLEVFWVQRGATLPFGSSLMMVAEKPADTAAGAPAAVLQAARDS